MQHKEKEYYRLVYCPVTSVSAEKRKFVVRAPDDDYSQFSPSKPTLTLSFPSNTIRVFDAGGDPVQTGLQLNLNKGETRTFSVNPLENMVGNEFFITLEGSPGIDGGKPVDKIRGTGIKVDSECVATQPAHRTRKTVGVGEEVKLTLQPTSLNPVIWSISGDGELSSTNGNPVTFTTHDQASTPTITATYSGHDCSVTFNVIEPTGVLFENVAPGGWESPPDQIWIGGQYRAKVYVQPDTVNFYNIKLYESGTAAQKTGYFTNKNIPDHAPNGPHDVTGYTAGKGSSMAGEDWIGGSASPEPFSDGTFTWSIDWLYNIGSGATQTIQTVDQIYTLDVDPEETIFRIDKGASGYHISTTNGVVQPN